MAIPIKPRMWRASQVADSTLERFTSPIADVRNMLENFEGLCRSGQWAEALVGLQMANKWILDLERDMLEFMGVDQEDTVASNLSSLRTAQVSLPGTKAAIILNRVKEALQRAIDAAFSSDWVLVRHLVSVSRNMLESVEIPQGVTASNFRERSITLKFAQTLQLPDDPILDEKAALIERIERFVDDLNMGNLSPDERRKAWAEIRKIELSLSLLGDDEEEGLLSSASHPPMVQCAWCGSIQRDDGSWFPHHEIIDGTHSICPDCLEEVMKTLKSVESGEDGGTWDEPVMAGRMGDEMIMRLSSRSSIGNFMMASHANMSGLDGRVSPNLSDSAQGFPGSPNVFHDERARIASAGRLQAIRGSGGMTIHVPNPPITLASVDEEMTSGGSDVSRRSAPVSRNDYREYMGGPVEVEDGSSDGSEWRDVLRRVKEGTVSDEELDSIWSLLLLMNMDPQMRAFSPATWGLWKRVDEMRKERSGQGGGGLRSEAGSGDGFVRLARFGDWIDRVSQELPQEAVTEDDQDFERAQRLRGLMLRVMDWARGMYESGRNMDADRVMDVVRSLVMDGYSDAEEDRIIGVLDRVIGGGSEMGGSSGMREGFASRLSGVSEGGGSGSCPRCGGTGLYSGKWGSRRRCWACGGTWEERTSSVVGEMRRVAGRIPEHILCSHCGRNAILRTISDELGYRCSSCGEYTRVKNPDHVSGPLRGEDYPHLCGACREVLDQVLEMHPEMEDDDDPESAVNFMYDHGLFCGGRRCVHGDRVGSRIDSSMNRSSEVREFEHAHSFGRDLGSSDMESFLAGLEPDLLGEVLDRLEGKDDVLSGKVRERIERALGHEDREASVRVSGHDHLNDPGGRDVLGSQWDSDREAKGIVSYRCPVTGRMSKMTDIQLERQTVSDPGEEEEIECLDCGGIHPVDVNWEWSFGDGMRRDVRLHASVSGREGEESDVLSLMMNGIGI